MSTSGSPWRCASSWSRAPVADGSADCCCIVGGGPQKAAGCRHCSRVPANFIVRLRQAVSRTHSSALLHILCISSVLINPAGKASNSLCSETQIAFPSGPEFLMLRMGAEGELDLPILTVQSGCIVLMLTLPDDMQDQPQPAAKAQRWWGPHECSLATTRRLCRPSSCNGTSAGSRGRTFSRASPRWVSWTENSVYQAKQRTCKAQAIRNGPSIVGIHDQVAMLGAKALASKLHLHTFITSR